MRVVPASANVRREWCNRVEAEYRSAAITQHLTLWLIQAGAPPDLIADGLRIVGDELAHAQLSHEVYTAADGDAGPRIDRGQLELPRRPSEPVERDLARWGVEIFCLGETVAVPLFRRLRELSTVDAARRALDRVLRDEVRHRQFGWDLLDWLMTHPAADSLRELIRGELPRMFAGLEHSYGAPNAARQDPAAISDDDRAWGLAPAAEYADILARTFTREFEPRFRDRDIDAKAAWDERLIHID
ncbi:MAG TPA: ferritin-like domain-containing protein [Kofleriaceae bacterium]|nr:ferritin-like domain-containing protein [Kofleriaceae bacterium]